VKVLVISHLYPSPGIERHLFVHEQILALQELGVKAQVLSPPRHLLFDRLGDLAYRRLRGLPSLMAGSYDLLHAHQALPDGALAQRLAADLGVPYIVTVHGADVYQHFRMGGAVERRAKDVLRAADAVMANSSAVAELLEGVVEPGKLTVVLNGTTGLGATVEPAEDYLPGEPLVLTVGYLIERKGIDHLIAAIGRLRRDRRRVHLAIVGDGRLRHALEEQAAAEGVADSVHFLGRMPHARVLALMARAQLFALPSWDEAFGLVYTEAMAQTTPVLATRGEGPEDFIEDGVNGSLVPARDPEAIAGVIAGVLDDPEGAAAIGAAGRATALELSWQRNARLTLEVYERVLAR